MLLSPYIIVIPLLNEFSKVDEPLYQQDVIYPIARSFGTIYS